MCLHLDNLYLLSDYALPWPINSHPMIMYGNIDAENLKLKVDSSIMGTT